MAAWQAAIDSSRATAATARTLRRIELPLLPSRFARLAPEMRDHFPREQLHAAPNLARLDSRQGHRRHQMSNPRAREVIFDARDRFVRRANQQGLAEERGGLRMAQLADRRQGGAISLVAGQIVGFDEPSAIAAHHVMRAGLGVVPRLVALGRDEHRAQLRDIEIVRIASVLAQRRVVHLLLIDAAGAHEMVAVARGAADRLGSARRQPDRWMRLLHRSRNDGDIGELVEASVDGDVALGPDAADDLGAFLQPRAALVARDVEADKFGHAIALAEAEIEPP